MRIGFREIKSQFKKHLKLYKALLEDKRTPKISKVLLSVAIGYALFPFDLIPDFIPILGQLDELVIIPILIYLALRFIPEGLYQEHKEKIFK